MTTYMCERTSWKVFDWFLEHFLKFMPNGGRSYVALVLKVVYNKSIFKDYLHTCTPLDHFHFLFGSSICPIEPIDRIQSRISSLEWPQNFTLSKLY